jgi:glycosyltransferase involved in cell wall biosynthesis
MKVTLLTGEFPPMRGGVADYTALLANHLRRLGADVSVLTSQRAKSARSAPPWVSPVIEDWGRGVWSAVARHTAAHRSDVVHVQYQTGAFDMSLGVNALPWINRLRGGQPPVVVTFHDLKEPYVIPKLGQARHLATAALAAGSDAIVITNSEDLKRVVGPRSDRSRWSWARRTVRAIPIGSNIPEVGRDYDRSLWRARIGARDDELVLAYFGFLGPTKGVDTLVTAFERLLERRRAVRLLMIGASAGDTSHPNRQYENAIRTALDRPGVRGRVTWTGFLASESVGAYLSAADVCCLPFRDGTSLRHGTLIAAIVQGLPIITTHTSPPHPRDPLPRLVSERNVVLVPAGDTTALVGAVERLLADASLRDALAAASRDLAIHFQWDSIARDTLRLYESVLGQSK